MDFFSSKYSQQNLLELFKLRLFYISALFIATAEIADLFLLDHPLFVSSLFLVSGVSADPET